MNKSARKRVRHKWLKRKQREQRIDLRIMRGIFFGALIGILFFGFFGVRGFWHSWHQMMYWQKTEGVIVDYIERTRWKTKSDGDYSCENGVCYFGSERVTRTPIVEYRSAEGQLRRVKTSNNSWLVSVQIGNHVTLYYDPQHPENARMLSFSGGLVMLAGLLLLIVFLVRVMLATRHHIRAPNPDSSASS
ncbi:DUF3592 domain-containing protein [Erwiniaceae bacterium L1_55_4]|nr:DUF3592 domain-containing protein [Erwiniaceae bacterium L1_55_4]